MNWIYQAPEIDTCRFCQSTELVPSRYIGDVSCQDCGEWQGDE